MTMAILYFIMTKSSDGGRSMKQYFEIVDVLARKTADLNGAPALEAEITLDDGTVGRAAVPAALFEESTGGEKVGLAVENINTEIQEALLGLNALDQTAIDNMLLEIDGTKDCSRLGTGAVLGASLAVAKAAAEASGVGLYNYIGGVNAKTLPVPVVLCESGAVVPAEADDWNEAMELCLDYDDRNEAFASVSDEEKEETAFIVPSDYPTLTGILDAVSVALRSGCAAAIDASKDCTDETFTADLSVAINAPFYYAGEMKGSALVKYNQLSRISEELFDAAVYAGSKLK